jgi:AraC-like DNA-binding protein
MKPMLEYLPKNANESFVTRFFDYRYYPTPWHFHPEYELVLVTESTGKRFVGDNISRFAPGNLALLGPYLPHLYRNDAAYYKKQTSLRAKSIVVHFKEDSFGENSMYLPEMQPLQALFSRAVRGLDIVGETNVIVSKQLEELLLLEGLSRWLKLLEILNIIAGSKEIQYISNQVVTGKNGMDSHRMNTVIQFVIKNFAREITIAEVAALANMANNSFSRYFSQRTRKSFTGFVNEVRLSHASKLLIETQKSVIDISLDSGFSNLSNFNRQFRKMYQVSPLQFRKQYLHTAAER